ncbi:MAG: helix-turn-helix transcriptional regulator [Lachnospiraceae bacterium]|nr:helix-turn-helix transcriptional regulator [Lachnospiraceae bacterium]
MKTGLSQEEVAWQAGISSRTYADIERGTVNARIGSILKICEVLEITPDTILTETSKTDYITKEDILIQIEGLPSRDKNAILSMLEAFIKAKK